MRIGHLAAVAVVLCLSFQALAQDSFDAIVSDAQLALDTGRFREATGLFESAAAADPSRRREITLDWGWAYLWPGYEALDSHDWETADECFTRAVELDSELSRYCADQHAYAVLQSVWDTINAARENHRRFDADVLEKRVARVLDIAPDYPGTHYCLGWLYEYKGDGASAKREYAAVIPRGGPSGPDQSLGAYQRAAREVFSQLRVSFEPPVHPILTQSSSGNVGTWRTKHFVITHHNEELARRVGNVLEWYLAQPALEGLLPAEPDLPEACEVAIYPTRAAFMAVTGGLDWATGISKVTFEGDRVTSAAVALCQATPHFFEASVPHELMHVRFAMAVHSPEHVPPWIWEGVAVCGEGTLSRRSILRLLKRGLKEDTLLSISDVISADKVPSAQHEFFYAESFAAVEALILKYGPDDFVALVRAPDTRPREDVIKRIYGLRAVDLEDLIIDWIDAQG